MKNYEVVAEHPLSAHIERVQKKDTNWSFVRICIDTKCGPIYVRPIIGSKEEFTLELMVDKHI